MKNHKTISITAAGLILLSITFSYNVYGYLDPGTGSYFFQLIIAGLLGSLFTIKLYWKKIRVFFKKILSRRKKNEKI